MALKTGGKPFPDDLEREVRNERTAMKREARARAEANKRPSEQPRHKKLRQRMATAIVSGQMSGTHVYGRAGKNENVLASRRAKNKVARKSRRANRG